MVFVQLNTKGEFLTVNVEQGNVCAIFQVHHTKLLCGYISLSLIDYFYDTFMVFLHPFRHLKSTFIVLHRRRKEIST